MNIDGMVLKRVTKLGSHVRHLALICGSTIKINMVKGKHGEGNYHRYESGMTTSLGVLVGLKRILVGIIQPRN